MADNRLNDELLKDISGIDNLKFLYTKFPSYFSTDGSKEDYEKLLKIVTDTYNSWLENKQK